MCLSIDMNCLKRLAQIVIMLLVLLQETSLVLANDVEHRLGQGIQVAAGMGVEVSNGDYGSNADATIVRLPLLVTARPLDTIDLSLEVPMVFLTSRTGSGVVVTSGGGGRRSRGTTGTVSTTGGGSVSEAGLGDINLTAGWTVLRDTDMTPKVRPTLYLKAPTGDKNRGLGTGTLEAGPGVSVSKWLGVWQLFAEGAYVFQDSNSSYDGKNYVSYLAGGGIQASDRLFVSLFAKGSTARVTEGTAPIEGRLKLNFMQSRRISWEFYALAGLSDASPAIGGGLFAMYLF